MDSALTYMPTKDNALSDVKDAESMRNLPMNTFPFVIFFNEIDTGNCLGSHKGESNWECSALAYAAFHMYILN